MDADADSYVRRKIAADYFLLAAKLQATVPDNHSHVRQIFSRADFQTVWNNGSVQLDEMEQETIVAWLCIKFGFDGPHWRETKTPVGFKSAPLSFAELFITYASHSARGAGVVRESVHYLLNG